MIFDSDGSRLLDEMEERPRVGNTVVTTLNLDWQKRAEKVLREGCKRGAFVVLDIQTGEVLVLASRPTYDINVWVPTIGQEEFDKLRLDEAKPQYARAFQAAYPPASTFKPVVAVTALTNDVITPDTRIDCPVRIKIGDTWMKNHSKYPDGRITVTRALARSNNVWFYQVGIDTRAASFLSVAERLGFGTKTGLPLFNENTGIVPTNDLMKAELGRNITHGDTANFAIGQGILQASPLQVAQMMAGLGNGQVLPRLRLVRQIQDEKGGVLSAPGPETRNKLNLDPIAVAVTQQGMKDVVHASYGTGKRASLSYTTMAGKTGTAQWMPNRELAWFAGFFPYEDPRFAFAVLYEGEPGEEVSGGRLAAPMVRSFFEPLKSEIKPMIQPPARAMIVVEEGEESELGVPSPDGEWNRKPGDDEGILRAIPVVPLDTEDPGQILGEDAPPPAAVVIEEGEAPPPAAVIVEEPDAEPVESEEP
jgi:penicillin-binding protein 2